QSVDRERVDAPIHLPDFALGRGSVLLLDYACNLLADPNNTAVAGGIVDHRRHDRRRRTAGSVALDEALQRVGGEKRHITRQQNQETRRALERGFGLKERMCRPKLWLLDHKSDVFTPA